MLNLRGHWRRPRIVQHSQFLLRGPRVHSSTPAVVADAIAAIVGHSVVINIVSNRRIHIRDRAVVIHGAVIPISAVVAAARISKAVIDAAVVTNMRTPVAGMPQIGAIIVTPPRRRPERVYPRRQHPRTGNPVVAGVCIIPVAGRPNVIVAGSGRLAVVGKRRRRFRGLDRLLIGGILSIIRWIVASRGRVALSGRRCGWGLLLRRLLNGSQISIGWISISHSGLGLGGLILGGLILRGLILRFVASTKAHN
jgi:hypothetical protein